MASGRSFASDGRAVGGDNFDLHFVITSLLITFKRSAELQVQVRRTAFSGATFFAPKGGVSVEGRLLSPLRPSSESPLLRRGDCCKISSRIRPFFFGAADEDTRFLFAFSKALVGAAPWPSASFASAAR